MVTLIKQNHKKASYIFNSIIKAIETNIRFHIYVAKTLKNLQIIKILNIKSKLTTIIL